MSDVKIPGGAGLGGVLGGVLSGVGGLTPPGAKPVDAPPLPPPPSDGFRGPQLPTPQGQLTGQAVGLPYAAAELAAQAEQIFTPQDAKQAFQAVYAAVREQLLDHPGLLPEQRGERANEFFTQYAKRFVQLAAGEGSDAASQAEPEPEAAEGSSARTQGETQTPERPADQRQERPVTPEEQRAMARQFAESLRELGFEQLKNLANGKDGVENANELLSAETLQQFAQLAKQQKISTQGQFPPRDGLQDTLPAPSVQKQELGENPAVLDRAGAERVRQDGDLQGPGNARTAQGGLEDVDEEDDDSRPRKKSGKRLLWGFLGTFRRKDENVRQAEEQWDRVTVAALLFLLLLVLVTVAVVSL